MNIFFVIFFLVILYFLFQDRKEHYDKENDCSRKRPTNNNPTTSQKFGYCQCRYYEILQNNRLEFDGKTMDCSNIFCKSVPSWTYYGKNITQDYKDRIVDHDMDKIGELEFCRNVY